MAEQTGRRVAIVTDSTSDIPPQLVEQYGIRVIPQILIMDDQTWRDQVDIDSPTFYKLLRSSSDFPSSSQPSVYSIQKRWRLMEKRSESARVSASSTGRSVTSASNAA